MMPPDFSVRYRVLLRRRNDMWIATQRARRGLELGVAALALCLFATPLALLVVEWNWLHPLAVVTILVGVLVGVIGLRLRRPYVDPSVDVALDEDRYDEAMRRVEAEARMYERYLRRVVAHRRTALALGAIGVFVGLCVH